MIEYNRKVELLIPASSLEVLKVAVTYGADAVYVGGEVFSLRAKAKNFSMDDLKEGAHVMIKKNRKKSGKRLIYQIFKTKTFIRNIFFSR